MNFINVGHSNIENRIHTKFEQHHETEFEMNDTSGGLGISWFIFSKPY